MRSTLHITMPDDLKAWVDAQAEQGGFATAEEYVREMIRQRQAMETSRRAVDAELLRALDSGPAAPFTAADLDTLRQQGLERLRATRNDVP